MIDRLLSALLLVIATTVLLTAAARPIAGLLHALTPPVLVIGVLVLAWQLVRYFTRP
jgi:hypothetical protein